jgi:hypothetical protein
MPRTRPQSDLDHAPRRTLSAATALVLVLVVIAGGPTASATEPLSWLDTRQHETDRNAPTPGPRPGSRPAEARAAARPLLINFRLDRRPRGVSTSAHALALAPAHTTHAGRALRAIARVVPAPAPLRDALLALPPPIAAA